MIPTQRKCAIPGRLLCDIGQIQKETPLRKMAGMNGSASVETSLAEEALSLVGKMGPFIYFLNRMESEMIKMAKSQFNVMLWMLRSLKRSQMKISQSRNITQNLKNLTKVFYLKKCAIRKEIEVCQAQLKIKMELIRRSKNLAQDVGESVKKASREAAFRSSWAAAQRSKGTNVKETNDLEFISLCVAENWWTLLQKCIHLVEARILLVRQSLKMIEKKEKWEKMLRKLFLYTAMAAQFGKIFQRRRIELKNIEIEDRVTTYQKHQKESLCAKVLEECEVMDFLVKESKQISEVLLSEFSLQEKVEK